VPLKRSLTFTGLHVVISQKTELFRIFWIALVFHDCKYSWVPVSADSVSAVCCGPKKKLEN
jgi:hypothetical protein